MNLLKFFRQLFQKKPVQTYSCATREIITREMWFQSMREWCAQHNMKIIKETKIYNEANSTFGATIEAVQATY